MELSKEIMLPFLISHLKISREKDGRKWIFDFQKSEQAWTQTDFQNAWSLIRSQDYLTEEDQDEVLEVIAEQGDQSGLVLQIEGIPNITKYCHFETPAAVPHVWKQRLLVARDVLPDELPMRINSGVLEERVVEMETEPSSWADVPKFYFLRKSFTYGDAHIKYNVSLSRNSKEPHMTMKDSGVSTAPTEYRMMMECQDVDDPLQVMKGLVRFIQIINNDYFVMSKQKLEEVIHEYHTLIRKKLTEVRRRPGEETTTSFFFAPKPVTLERMHILDPSVSYGIVSIQHGYAVTDKADGERYLLYIHSDGQAYLINNTLDIKPIGLRAKSAKMHHSLIDGEFIPSSIRKDGETDDMFMAFDVYFVGGESVMDLPLLHDTKPCRYTKLIEIVETDMWDVSDDAYIQIDYKRHIAAEGDDMFVVCKKILESSKHLPYEIDGLIFTPKDLPVFGYYPNKPVKITENVRWDRVLKWKPSEQNTIDFLVEIDERKRIHPVTKEPYVVAKLFTGYNATQWEAISVMEGLRLRYDKEYNKAMRNVGDIYRAKLFKPISHYERGVEEAHIPIREGGYARAENGDMIGTKMIVEFAYNPDPSVHVSRRWVPLRVREDKTRIFQRTGKLSKTANDLSVAMSIWRTIHNPVTTAMITGVQDAKQSDAPDELEEKLLGVDDTYYAREIPRQHMLSVHMLNFHNQGIKKKLYFLSQSRDSLLELACGMAGDLPRWRDAGYKFVLGVDLVRDNITHPREGSYARVQKQKRAITAMIGGVETVIYPDMVFAIGDCALPLHDGSAAEGMDEESKKLLRLVFRRDNVTSQPYLRYITGRAARGFDVVSCQFAIHYFFQSPEKLHGFLSNVSRNLKKNGIFFATFMDGDHVDSLLSSFPSGVAEGKKLDDQVTVWAIIKRYQSYITADEEPFGKLVDVYLENTNRLIPEFLVNLDTLIKHAHAHGLELADTAMFSQTFADLRNEIPDDPSERTHLDTDILELEKDPIQTRFSFLNRWVVFRKM
jgi:hypothetical protein